MRAAELIVLRAMASEVVVSAAGGPDDPAADVAAALGRLEAAWSRFLPESEISRLNASGRAEGVSPETVLLVEAGIAAWEETGGLYDPTVLAAVRAVGYTDGGASTRGAPAVPGCAGIRVDGSTVTLPAGVGFDPGGIGKGLAADLVSAGLVDRGASDVVVSVGGDLRVRAGARAVEVEDPFDRDRVIAVLHVADGGVATSSTLARRFRGGHDIVDPRTGRPAESDAVAVTVVAAGAARAEALATAVLVAGIAEGLELLDRVGAAGLAVDTDGSLAVSSRLGEFL